jgi:hypothetical protein
MWHLRPTVWLWLVLTAGGAAAGDCRALRAAHGDAVFTCTVAYNDGKGGKSKTACFLDPDEGFAFISEGCSSAKGPIHAANCHNADGVITLGAWMRDRGMAADPGVREPKAVTSPAAAIGANRRMNVPR